MNVAVISVDAYPFLAGSDLIFHLEDTGIGMVFSGCTVPADSKQSELGGSDQETSSVAGKNTEAVLVPCCAWKCPTTISFGVDISKVPGYQLLQQMISQRGSQKLLY